MAPASRGEAEIRSHPKSSRIGEASGETAEALLLCTLRAVSDHTAPNPAQ